VKAHHNVVSLHPQICRLLVLRQAKISGTMMSFDPLRRLEGGAISLRCLKGRDGSLGTPSNIFNDRSGSFGESSGERSALGRSYREVIKLER
jgi:hypothetical protein